MGGSSTDTQTEADNQTDKQTDTQTQQFPNAFQKMMVASKCKGNIHRNNKKRKQKQQKTTNKMPSCTTTIAAGSTQQTAARNREQKAREQTQQFAEELSAQLRSAGHHAEGPAANHPAVKSGLAEDNYAPILYE